MQRCFSSACQGYEKLRVLGLDIGDRRIGLAIGETAGTLAVPLGVVPRTSTRKDVARILEVARERGMERIVAGLPLSINGSLGPQAKKVQAFLKALRASTPLPVETVDERYSTSEAERLMRQGGGRPSRDRGSVDAAAATIILQDYLDQRAQVADHALGSGNFGE